MTTTMTATQLHQIATQIHQIACEKDKEFADMKKAVRDKDREIADLNSEIADLNKAALKKADLKKATLDISPTTTTFNCVSKVGKGHQFVFTASDGKAKCGRINRHSRRLEGEVGGDWKLPCCRKEDSTCYSVMLTDKKGAEVGISYDGFALCGDCLTIVGNHLAKTAEMGQSGWVCRYNLAIGMGKGKVRGKPEATGTEEFLGVLRHPSQLVDSTYYPVAHGAQEKGKCHRNKLNFPVLMEQDSEWFSQRAFCKQKLMLPFMCDKEGDIAGADCWFWKTTVECDRDGTDASFLKCGSMVRCSRAYAYEERDTGDGRYSEEFSKDPEIDAVLSSSDDE